VSSRA